MVIILTSPYNISYLGVFEQLNSSIFYFSYTRSMSSFAVETNENRYEQATENIKTRGGAED